MGKSHYPDHEIETMVRVLRACPRGMEASAARERISRELGRVITSSQICHAFQARGMGTPKSYIGQDEQRPPSNRPGPAKTKPPREDLDIPIHFEEPPSNDTKRGPTMIHSDEGPTLASRDPLIRQLIDLTKRGPVAFDALCDKLDLSPKKCRALVERAQKAGVNIDVAHDHVEFRGSEPSGERQDTGITPSGARQIVGVISDTHLGSKYCLRDQLRDFVHYAYDSGVREILHAGDVLDGRYRHGMFELTHSGIELQCQDLFEVLPKLPGLTYHGITGNHDQTFSDEVGMDPGDYIEWYFRQHGRTDIKFYGVRGAYLNIRGAIVELWHPKKSPGYSLSYQLQNHIRDYGVGQKPDVLIAGHWHIAVYLEQRGVHALAGGTFQGGGSAFSKSLGGAPSIGGTLLSWEVTQGRTLRRFVVERSAYYEKEEVRELVLA